jgi:hypothetical protein
MLSLAVAVACSEDPGVTEPDPAIAPFVGTWDAEVFTVTNSANPAQVADLLENGSFFIVIEPSGLYTASLFFGIALPPEIGQLSVSGNFVTLTPNDSSFPPATSAFTFVQPNYLTLTGPTEFDFNLDGTSEAAEAHIELRRRPV